MIGINLTWYILQSGHDTELETIQVFLFLFFAITGDELTRDELIEDELTGDELNGDEVTEDELTGDELTGDELTRDELTGQVDFLIYVYLNQ